MNKAIVVSLLGLVACGSTATVADLYSEPVPDVPPVVTVADSGGPETPQSKPPDSGTDSSVVVEASTDAAEAGQDADADVPDAGPDAAPPFCQVRGSCRYTVAFCDEFEDTGAVLATQKSDCLAGNYTWSDGPCTRVNTIGTCNLVFGADVDCPKYREVYYPPASVAQATNKCNNMGGVFVP